MTDDREIEIILNRTNSVALSDTVKLQTGTSGNLHSHNQIIYRENKNNNQRTEHHEAMTQTYADPKDIYKRKYDKKEKIKSYEFLLPSNSKQISTNVQHLGPDPPPLPPPRSVPPKRTNKMKNLSEYRPLKDKVSLEFESIPEADSNSSSFEVLSDNSSRDQHFANTEEIQSNHEKDLELVGHQKSPVIQNEEERNYSDVSSSDALRTLQISKQKFASDPDIMGRQSRLFPSESNMPISQEYGTLRKTENGAQKSTANKGERPKRQIHPKIEILGSILSDSGIITPYEDHRRNQMLQTTNPEAPDRDFNHKNPVIEGIDVSPKEPTTDLPQTKPPPPLSPPFPPFLHPFLKFAETQQTTFNHLTSHRESSDTKADNTPSSSSTSGYISPDMPTPPLIASPGEPHNKFAYLPAGALRAHSVLRSKQGGGSEEGDGDKNNGNETTKEPQHWRQGSQLGNSPPRQISGW